MNTFTLDNIGNVTQRPLPGGGCEIAFSSANPGMCHQLYVNSAMTDWTESAQCRRFVAPAQPRGRTVAIAAVASHQRAVDFSALLPSHASDACAFRTAISPPADPVNCTVFLLDDHAGLAPESIVASIEGRRAWQGAAGLGCERFGRGGWGFDGTNAPGLGSGNFALGRFGFDLLSVHLEATLIEEGMHRLTVGFAFAGGQTQHCPSQTMLALPPPPPIQTLKFVRYDRQSKTLILHIE